MIRCAIVDASMRAVVNVIEYDQLPVGVPPGMKDGMFAVESDAASPGWRWDGTRLMPPPQAPIVVLPWMVKQEASRRILEAYPDWKQLNMNARRVELLDIRITVGTWDQQQDAEAAALRASLEWVKSVRSASDRLEAMSPTPSDYTKDLYWPPNE